MWQLSPSLSHTSGKGKWEARHKAAGHNKKKRQHSKGMPWQERGREERERWSVSCLPVATKQATMCMSHTRHKMQGMGQGCPVLPSTLCV